MSLDGYVAGPNQSVDDPLGEGGEALHEWAFAVRSFREPHGMKGGETGVDDDVVAESLAERRRDGHGAQHVRRRAGAVERGPAVERLVGDDPPFHTPVFVLTHHAREPLAMEGGTTFHFVTDGIEAALAQATEAAGGKDVVLGGGAEAARQYLGAGLVDDMEIHVVPVLLGSGERLFDLAPGWQRAVRAQPARRLPLGRPLPLPPGAVSQPLSIRRSMNSG